MKKIILILILVISSTHVDAKKPSGISWFAYVASGKESDTKSIPLKDSYMSLFSGKEWHCFVLPVDTEKPDGEYKKSNRTISCSHIASGSSSMMVVDCKENVNECTGSLAVSNKSESVVIRLVGSVY